VCRQCGFIPRPRAQIPQSLPSPGPPLRGCEIRTRIISTFMASIKIYGIAAHLKPVKFLLSDIIHSCVVEALELPTDRRFHRFFPLDPADFLFPPDRSERYLIVEIVLFEGRPAEIKRRLIRLLIDRVCRGLELNPDDLEITIFEAPRQNWGIRGRIGDEPVGSTLWLKEPSRRVS
jgi:phenylpyruvate tautomerase PptA (4-oxalocrotonate tautomerase family)